MLLQLLHKFCCVQVIREHFYRLLGIVVTVMEVPNLHVESLLNMQFFFFWGGGTRREKGRKGGGGGRKDQSTANFFRCSGHIVVWFIEVRSKLGT